MKHESAADLCEESAEYFRTHAKVHLQIFALLRKIYRLSFSRFVLFELKTYQYHRIYRRVKLLGTKHDGDVEYPCSSTKTEPFHLSMKFFFNVVWEILVNQSQERKCTSQIGEV